jgi:hypothetical protein
MSRARNFFTFNAARSGRPSPFELLMSLPWLSTLGMTHLGHGVALHLGRS